MREGELNIPDDPIIYYIEGDGIGIDITPVMKKVVDSSVEKAYSGTRQIFWNEVLAGQKAFNATGEWLPEETKQKMRSGLISIKGPLTTPVGGGIRSLNVALRQQLDLYACVRPVRWYEGTPSPVRDPGAVDMIIFRENSEDVYAGIEWESGNHENARKLFDDKNNQTKNNLEPQQKILPFEENTKNLNSDKKIKNFTEDTIVENGKKDYKKISKKKKIKEQLYFDF